MFERVLSNGEIDPLMHRNLKHAQNNWELTCYPQYEYFLNGKVLRDHHSRFFFHKIDKKKEKISIVLRVQDKGSILGNKGVNRKTF